MPVSQYIIDSLYKYSLEQAELRRQALYAKQGRSIQFRTQAERDRWLQEEMAEIKRTITVQQKQVSTLVQHIECVTISSFGHY